MNKQKENAEIDSLLNIPLERESIPSSEAGKIMGLSDKTVRARMRSADELLARERLGHIAIKQKKGMMLEADEEQKRGIRNLLEGKGRPDSSPLDQERMSQALRMILKSAVSGASLTINEIADALYISAPTAAKAIQECRSWLSGFHLELVTVRNKGIEVKGEEMAFRAALREFVSHRVNQVDLDQELLYFFPGLNVPVIHEVIMRIEKEWNFSFTDASFAEILTYISIATYENMQGRHQLEFHYQPSELDQYNEFTFAQKVYTTVNERMNLKNREEEIAYLTVQILCSQVIHSPYDYDPEKMVHQYDQKLRGFVKKTIAVVSDVMNIDLTKDERLYSGLLNHIRALIFRLKYGQPLETTLNISMQEEFPLTMRVVWLVSTLFEEYFNMSISDDELSYIALYIQSAIDATAHPVKALLVSSYNMSITNMLQERIERNIPQISALEVRTVHEYQKSPDTDAELIISTVELANEKKKVVVLKKLFGEENDGQIRNAIDEIRREKNASRFHFDPVCHQLFEPDLMMCHAHYESKNQLLKDMCRLLDEKGYATRKYYDSVLKREEDNTTSIGQGIAIPHGNMAQTNESKIVIVTLDEPIDWGKEKVSVVFLLNILMKNESEISKWQAFYRQFINMTDSPETMDHLKKISNPVELYYYLIQ